MHKNSAEKTIEGNHCYNFISVEKSTQLSTNWTKVTPPMASKWTWRYGKMYYITEYQLQTIDREMHACIKVKWRDNRSTLERAYKIINKHRVRGVCVSWETRTYIFYWTHVVMSRLGGDFPKVSSTMDSRLHEMQLESPAQGNCLEHQNLDNGMHN